jgi:hypothetical protein
MFVQNYSNVNGIIRSRVSSVGYGLDDQGSIPGRGDDGNISLRYRVQTDSGPHPASYAMGTGGSYPEDRAAGA